MTVADFSMTAEEISAFISPAFIGGIIGYVVCQFNSDQPAERRSAFGFFYWWAAAVVFFSGYTTVAIIAAIGRFGYVLYKERGDLNRDGVEE